MNIKFQVVQIYNASNYFHVKSEHDTYEEAEHVILQIDGDSLMGEMDLYIRKIYTNRK